ncbi:MAG: class I SAM-dependent methyltransferase [Burkholderiales bacterium]
MTNDSSQYFIGVHGRELERLRDQHAAWQPETQALWREAGVGAGQHIVDLGSGPGFAALDLAALVGPAGRITALDKASPYLAFCAEEARRRGIGNVFPLDIDMIVADAIPGAFDAAFSRFFLAFLIDGLDAALATIYRSLKPGGVLAAMEYLTLRSASVSPPVRGFDAHTEAWAQYYRSNGGDTGVGRYLPQKLTAAGFHVTYTHCVGGMARPSHRWWSWWGRLMEDFGETLVTNGFMAAGALQDLHHDWALAARDPNAFMYTPVLLQLVARKPS